MSYKHIKKLGLGKNASLTGDYAFCMNSVAIKSLPSKLERIANAGDFAIITIRQHDFVDNNGEKEYLDTLFRVADYLNEKYSLNVVFVAHVKGPNSFEDDRIIVRKMKDLDSRKRFEYVLDQYTPQELFEFYSKSELMIGTRFHSCIFALANNIPTIAISYSGYKANIMKQFNLDRFMLRIDDIKMNNYKRIQEMIDEIMKNRKQIISNIETKKRTVMDAIKDDTAFGIALLNLSTDNEK